MLNHKTSKNAHTPQPMEIVFTPRDIEEIKPYKDQETFTANNFSYVKVKIMIEKITFKRENV